MIDHRLFVMGLVVGCCVVAGPRAASADASPSPSRLDSIAIGGAPDGRGFSVEFVGRVAAPAAAVARALFDVAAFPGWVPKIRAIDNVAPEDDDSITFESTVGLPWPVGEVRERLRAQREEEDGATRLRWDHVQGDMRRNVAVWTVTPIDEQHTLVQYEARLWFRSWLPPFLLRMAERSYTPWFLACLEHQALLLSGGPAASLPPPLPPSPSSPTP